MDNALIELQIRRALTEIVIGNIADLEKVVTLPDGTHDFETRLTILRCKEIASRLDCGG